MSVEKKKRPFRCGRRPMSVSASVLRRAIGRARPLSRDPSPRKIVFSHNAQLNGHWDANSLPLGASATGVQSTSCAARQRKKGEKRGLLKTKKKDACPSPPQRHRGPCAPVLSGQLPQIQLTLESAWEGGRQSHLAMEPRGVLVIVFPFSLLQALLLK